MQITYFTFRVTSLPSSFWIVANFAATTSSAISSFIFSIHSLLWKVYLYSYYTFPLVSEQQKPILPASPSYAKYQSTLRVLSKNGSGNYNLCISIKYMPDLIDADVTLSAAPRRTIQRKGAPADTNWCLCSGIRPFPNPTAARFSDETSENPAAGYRICSLHYWYFKHIR